MGTPTSFRRGEGCLFCVDGLPTHWPRNRVWSRSTELRLLEIISSPSVRRIFDGSDATRSTSPNSRTDFCRTVLGCNVHRFLVGCCEHNPAIYVGRVGGGFQIELRMVPPRLEIATTSQPPIFKDYNLAIADLPHCAIVDVALTRRPANSKMPKSANWAKRQREELD